MASIFQKIRTFTLASAHKLLDIGLETMSIEALEQHSRDLDAAAEEVADQAAIADNRRDVMRERTKTITVEVTTKNSDIDMVLSNDDPSDDSLAEKLDVEVQALEAELEELKTELVDADSIAEDLAKTADAMQRKHVELVKQIKKLTSEKKVAEAKEKAARAIKTGMDVAGSVAGVDNIATKIRERGVIADASLRRVMGRVSDTLSDDVAKVRAKDRIANRRAALVSGKSVAQEETPETPAAG